MKYFLFIILAVFIISCSSTKKTNQIKSVAFESISKNSNSGFEELTLQYFTNQDTFEKAWKIAWSNFSDVVPLPTVDFNRQMVALIAIGMKKNGGYNLKINAVHSDNEAIAIDYTEITPNPKCNSTQAIVFPYEFIKFDKTSKIIKFVGSNQQGNCQ